MTSTIKGEVKQDVSSGIVGATGVEIVSVSALRIGNVVYVNLNIKATQNLSSTAMIATGFPKAYVGQAQECIHNNKNYQISINAGGVLSFLYSSTTLQTNDTAALVFLYLAE